MAVTLIASVGGTDSNSIAAVAEADAYFAQLLDGAKWDALDSDTKARALISATNAFEELSWWGEKATDEQALSWPRYYLGVSDGTSIPKAIKTACFEHALFLATSNASGGGQSAKRAQLRAEGVTSFRLGDLSETYAPLSSAFSTSDAMSQFSGRVQRLIADWIRTGFRLESGRRPIYRRLGNGSYDQNGHWWPEELGG